LAIPQPLVEDLDPAAPVLGLIASEVETGDFGTAQATGKADEQDRPVAQAP
jgi:hypothetical protein